MDESWRYVESGGRGGDQRRKSPHEPMNQMKAKTTSFHCTEAQI